ncbi:hypothetical protein ZHAS_00010396 [Anopheles sinensis]|uniref:Uncharacterized protein n=1 Tax=Anopheles sinensis TaxID=74873 RepID=A0A084VXG9_ANOSI|nr:hypothetical protein ZHAS_00010396 [Anopheles sinensis]
MCSRKSKLSVEALGKTRVKYRSEVNVGRYRRSSNDFPPCAVGSEDFRPSEIFDPSGHSRNLQPRVSAVFPWVAFGRDFPTNKASLNPIKEPPVLAGVPSGRILSSSNVEGFSNGAPGHVGSVTAMVAAALAGVGS